MGFLSDNGWSVVHTPHGIIAKIAYYNDLPGWRGRQKHRRHLSRRRYHHLYTHAHAHKHTHRSIDDTHAHVFTYLLACLVYRYYVYYVPPIATSAAETRAFVYSPPKP